MLIDQVAGVNRTRDELDQLGQQMTALRLSLEAIWSWAGGDPIRQEHARRAQQLAEQLDHSIDVVSWMLRPAVPNRPAMPVTVLIQQHNRHVTLLVEDIARSASLPPRQRGAAGTLAIETSRCGTTIVVRVPSNLPTPA
jgi:outer membrane biogenesis lipoprotein LolB